jgi:transposase
LVENEIPPLPLGQRNWLFLGHEESAQIAVLFYSLIQSAKLNNLDPRIYLDYLIMQVHALRKKEVDPKSLLPHRIDHEKLFADTQLQSAKEVIATSAFNKNQPSK